MAQFNPKQKRITVYKAKCDKQHLYTQFNLEAFNNARKNLNSNAFILWTYIAQNQNGYTFGLSSTDVFENSTMKKTAYDNAVKELIEKGYLKLVSGQTIYEFYEVGSQYNENNSNVLLQNIKEKPLQDNQTTAKQVHNTTPKQDDKTTTLYCDNTRNITIDTTNNNTRNITVPDPPPPWEPQPKLIDFQILEGIPEARKKQKSEKLWELQHNDGAWVLYTTSLATE